MFCGEELREKEVHKVDSKHPHSLLGGVRHPEEEEEKQAYLPRHPICSAHHIPSGLLMEAGSLSRFTTRKRDSVLFIPPTTATHTAVC